MATQLLEPPFDQREATLDDLLRYDGKAELIDGKIVPLMATGKWPNRIAGRIYSSLERFADETDSGEPYTDNMAFAVEGLSSGRRSFSPDAAYFLGESGGRPMGFAIGAPTFAVEVRSENDYSVSADLAMRDKRAEYFEAGTLIVWDLDPVSRIIRSYHRDNPQSPIEYRSGDVASAGEAVPGWQMAVDDMFRGCPDLKPQDLR